LTEEQYEKILQDFIKKQNEDAEKIKYTPKEEDFQKLDEFLSKVGYDGPKKDDVDESVKFTPNEDELKKIEDILSNYSKNETDDIKDEVIEETSENVDFDDTETNIEIQEVNSPVINTDEQKINKVLKYFK